MASLVLAESSHESSDLCHYRGNRTGEIAVYCRVHTRRGWRVSGEISSSVAVRQQVDSSSRGSLCLVTRFEGLSLRKLSIVMASGGCSSNTSMCEIDRIKFHSAFEPEHTRI